MTGLVVVGAGPAGLAAAVAAADAGVAVTVLDAGVRPGGQYLRQPVSPQVAALSRGAARSARASSLLRRATAHPGIRLHAGTQVWHATAPSDRSPAVLHTVTDGRTGEIPAPALVVATGAHERVLPFPGWDLPGVVTAGAAQALLKGEGVLVGRRVVVAGSGPFLLTVAADLAKAGAEVVAVAEATSPVRWGRHAAAIARNPAKLREGATYAAALRRARVPVRTRTAVTAVVQHGDGLLVTVSRVDAQWRPTGPATEHAVDAVCVGHGFVPSLELAVGLGCATEQLAGTLVVSADARQRSSVPGVWVAGEATGVGGADLAISEGEIAGSAAAAALGALDERELLRRTQGVRRRRDRERAFAVAMHAVHAVPAGWTAWLRDDTVVCRCEDVTVAALRAGVEDLGADDVRSAKLVTRAGMGLCQARMCGDTVCRLLETFTGRPTDPASFASRPLAVPLPLGALAAPPNRPATEGPLS